jgi:hypothetical protein
MFHDPVCCTTNLPDACELARRQKHQAFRGRVNPPTPRWGGLPKRPPSVEFNVRAHFHGPSACPRTPQACLICPCLTVNSGVPGCRALPVPASVPRAPRLRWPYMFHGRTWGLRCTSARPQKPAQAADERIPRGGGRGQRSPTPTGAPVLTAPTHAHARPIHPTKARIHTLRCAHTHRAPLLPDARGAGD